MHKARAGIQSVEVGVALLDALARAELPLTADDVDTMLAQVRERGMARAMDSLLPAMAGFCAPVFDSDGHMVLGIVALGSLAGFDPDRDGPVANALRSAAARLSTDPGHAA